jgi:aryl-alcohol dehydrogenase-like predicted oxidoreductase
MQYVNLGKSGLKVSRVCLGMMTYGAKTWRDWTLGEEEARPIIRHAAELGINFYDTADVYSLGASEEVTGKVLKEIYRGRDEYVMATKVHGPMGDKPNQRGLSRKHILEGMDASLRRLGLEYVDLYQIHRWDPSTPIEETLAALDNLVAAGKTRYIGASSMSAWQFAKALYTADLVYREEEREMIPLCLDQGVGIIPWSPLARGFLVGNRTPEKGGETARAKSDAFAHSMYYEPTDFDIAERLGQVAGRLGLARARVALAWMLQRPGITAPIVGASKLSHLDDAVAAVDLRLDEGDVAQLEAPYRPKRILGM